MDLMALPWLELMERLKCTLLDELLLTSLIFCSTNHSKRLFGRSLTAMYSCNTLYSTPHNLSCASSLCYLNIKVSKLKSKGKI